MYERIDTYFDPKIVKHEGVYLSQQTTLQDLWCKTGKDLDTHLSFAGSPLHIYKCSNQDGRQEYLAVIDHPLESYNLMNLLFHTAPEQSHDLQGVVDDWTEKNQELMKAHAHGLKEVWDKFIPHLQTFTRTLDATEYSIFLTPKSVQQLFLDRSEKLWNCIFQYNALSPGRYTSVNNFLVHLYKKYYIKNNDNIFKTFPSPELFYSSRLEKNDQKSIEHKLESDLKDFLSTTTDQELSELYMLYNRYTNRGSGKLDILFSKEGKAHSNQYDAISISNLTDNDQHIEITINDIGKHRYRFSQGSESRNYDISWNYPHWEIVSSNYGSNVNDLYPVIHWYTDENKRYIDVSPFSKLSYTTRNILSSYITSMMNFKGVRFSGNRMNTLVELLTAAYYHPDVRNDEKLWPKKLGFHEYAEKKQNMMEAQVPVLAIMKEPYIASKNPLLEVMENFVRE